MAQRIPHISEPIAEQLPDGSYKVNDNWHRYLDSISGDLGEAQGELPGKAGRAQTVCASFVFKYPEAETVLLILNAQFAWTITSTVTRTEAGTATVTVLNGASSLNANSASNGTTQTVSQSSAVSVGANIAVTFSSVSSDCENLCLTIWGTRTLAS